MSKQNQYFPQSRPHPGETLAEKLDEIAMGPKEFALRTGKPEKTIIAVLKGDSSITPDMAVQFENVTKIPANFWINHQRGYDEYIAREKRKADIDAAVSWAKQFPIADMVKKGWLPRVSTIQEKTMEMLTFFGFANFTAWENYYFNQQLKLETNDYSEKKFKEALPLIKSIMANHPDGFFSQLQSICLEAGVKVVHTPCINKAPINGSTRWLKDTPLIQLTGRYNRNDSFWFTFFHEAGHILLHGKKGIFLENLDYSDKDMDKEQEADKFACKWTLTEDEEAEILATAHLSKQDIRDFAKQFTTHPAIIIGRLQHKKVIPYSLGREYFEPIIFD
jgi:HTH-type transcriptional regulator/antitoxin HigA